MTDWIEHFEKRDVVLGVVGLGYVGLPLAVEAAGHGIRVIGFDVKGSVVESVNNGHSHIKDLTDDDVGGLRGRGLLEATTDTGRLRECDAISICVPTPLSKTRDPDVSYILAATDAVAAGLRAGQLIVLESTTYPGTTRELVLPALAATGLRVGRDFFLCFSPERVDPGNQVWKTHNTPKVIGGITPSCTRVGRALYERFIETMVPVSSTDAAELTKLLENTYRAVNIGLVNETAIIADRLGVDVWEVIDAAATKPFGFQKFTPGPGLGGHCIPVDPHYLSWKMRTMNYRTRFIELASEINSAMPEFVVGKVREALNQGRRPVNGSRILVLGVAYKPDVDDVRESPALDIIRLLEAEGAEVGYHDPHVPEVREDGRSWRSVPLTDEELDRADVVVVVTNHSCMDMERVVTASRTLVDARNATAGIAGARDVGRPERWIVKVEAPKAPVDERLAPVG
ncbi:MAG TPA: nucleotide sugar dehydrogenase [Longimicrobiales bacterium]|jgi:UDP-N-acetyl-D-glucosamine dehydrogenase